ncbi:sigma-54-dependent transcriptional regulator [Jiulongibacter sediminis]|uniref:Regulator n=1 Tax=Jiulongibacter sediminis TaxID=1605367 RepID=A0A0P7BJE9_9BACT|nr:sigma-54 dependent transcriptional regulator [Jiulongibacter sediminis]KPM47310.1 regulator [Jiulongibacter sediminis]TBX22868.1 regulator [Jiulongibacter sediminis]
MNSFKIFVVEDDPWYREVLSYHLSLNPDYEVIIFETGKECLSSLHQRPDLITIDFSLPDMTGDDLYKAIRKVDAKVPMIVISSQEDIKVAVGMMKMGVADYLVKDENTKDFLWNSILRIRENLSLKEEVETLREELGQKYSFEKSLIGQSPALKKVFALMNKAIETNINVSITGETGTGKELVAKAIHFNGSRRRKKFIPVNMGAIPKELIESELFGHEKGAFTGAVGRKIGKFEEANGGTIFLDEIAELDLNLQSKLLRVLQEREVVRVGGSEVVPLDIRIITATHKDLKEEVRQGNFREDLYFRLIGMPINLPPLRERGGDVLILTNHFLEGFVKENKTKQIRISDGAAKKLMNYSFPGNVRELKATVDLAAVICSDHLIQESDITYLSSQKEKLFVRGNKTLREHTCDIIQYYLEKNEGDVLKTAADLDIGKSTIYKMMKDGEIS